MVFTLNKIWQRFCDEYKVSSYSGRGSFEVIFNDEDLELIEVQKHEKPSMSLAVQCRAVYLDNTRIAPDFF